MARDRVRSAKDVGRVPSKVRCRGTLPSWRAGSGKHALLEEAVGPFLGGGEGKEDGIYLLAYMVDPWEHPSRVGQARRLGFTPWHTPTTSCCWPSLGKGSYTRMGDCAVRARLGFLFG